MRFPWPFLQECIWVETCSIFIKDKMIIHEHSKKERAQKIDLRTDWTDFFVEECWKWNHGQAPTLQLLCEIGIVAAAWLKYTPYSIEDSKRYWWTNTPFWLVLPSDHLGENKMIENLDYFGWVQEPESINEVTVATKSDEKNLCTPLDSWW